MKYVASYVRSQRYFPTCSSQGIRILTRHGNKTYHHAGEIEGRHWSTQQQPKWSTNLSEGLNNSSFTRWSQQGLHAVEESLDDRECMENFFNGPGLNHIFLAKDVRRKFDHRARRGRPPNEEEPEMPEDDDGDILEPEDDGMDEPGNGEDPAPPDYPFDCPDVLHKYVCYIHEQSENIPMASADCTEFAGGFLDEVGRWMNESETSFGGEDEGSDEDADIWTGVQDDIPEDDRQNILWCIFLHSVRDNFFGMVKNRCIWYCRQHHTHQLLDTISLEWLGSDSMGEKPSAIHYDRRVKAWRESRDPVRDISREAVKTALSSFDEAYQARRADEQVDGDFCFVSLSIGMEVKVIEVTDEGYPAGSRGHLYSVKAAGRDTDCEYFGKNGRALRLHWSSESARFQRRIIRGACKKACDNNRNFKEAINYSSVVDRMSCVYPSWGCGKKVEQEGDHVIGRPCQMKSGVQLFADHVDRHDLKRYFCETISDQQDLTREQKNAEIANGLFNLLLPTADADSELSGSYPVVNTYEAHYRAAPKKNDILRNGVAQFMVMCRMISGVDKPDNRTTMLSDRIASLQKYVENFQKAIWKWQSFCPNDPALRIEDCTMWKVHTRGHMSVDVVGHQLERMACTRVEKMMNLPLQNRLLYSRRFELEETVVNIIPVFTVMRKRAELQLESFGRVDPSIVDHLALLVGLVQHVICGWDRVQSPMKMYYASSAAGRFLRANFEHYGFICNLPATFFFGGMKGLFSNSMDHILGSEQQGIWNVVNHLGKLSFLSQNTMLDSLKHLRRDGNGRRWACLTSVLSDVLSLLDIRLWPRLMMELLAINLMELLCVHNDFGMAVELVTVDGSKNNVAGYRMKALWKVISQGDSHDWKFVERKLPSNCSMPHLEHRAQSFLSRKAMEEIAQLTLEGRTPETKDRTAFANEWMIQMETFMAMKTGRLKTSQTKDAKDIHKVMMSVMMQEMKRIQDHSHRRDLDCVQGMYNLILYFMHSLPCDYWALCSRNSGMRENQDVVCLQKLCDIDSQELKIAEKYLEDLQRERAKAQKKGGAEQNDTPLSNYLANQWIDTVLANSFSLMSYPRKRMNMMSMDNITFANLAGETSQETDPGNEEQILNYGDGPGVRPLGYRSYRGGLEDTTRNGLLLVHDTDMPRLSERTRFVQKR